MVFGYGERMLVSCHKESALVLVIECGAEAMARDQGVIGLEWCGGVIERDLAVGY
jgi:hypothetical protein